MKLFGKRFWASVLAVCGTNAGFCRRDGVFGRRFCGIIASSALFVRYLSDIECAFRVGRKPTGAERTGRIDAGCIQLIGSNFFQ